MKKTGSNLSLKILTGFLAILCLPGAVTSSGAGAPPVNSPTPGFYRTMVGDFEVTALSDGTNQRSVAQQAQLLQGDQTEIDAQLNRSYPDGQLASAVNVFLINTGSRLILVDAGNGKLGSPSMGNVMDNLRAAGYQPAKIDEIYLTHMHPDHVGGLISGTERAFPNATVYVNRSEAEYWLSETNLQAAPDTARRTYQAARATLTPYIQAGKFMTFEGNTDLAPGIRAESAFGHTPGHTLYFIENRGKTLVLWGDIIHVAAVQFENPAVAISFDSDTSEAVKSRQQVLKAAAENGWLIGGVHLAFPGLGHVRANNGKGYLFLPLGTLPPK